MPIAGIVEKMPSGSQVWLLTQRWLPRPKRDQSSSKRSHQAAIVRGASPSDELAHRAAVGDGQQRHREPVAVEQRGDDRDLLLDAFCPG